MKDILNAANVIASIAGAAAAETATGGLGAAIGGALSLNELLRRFRGKSPALQQHIATDLTAELGKHHLTPSQKQLIPQMVEAAPLTPSEVMAAARTPTRLVQAMRAKLTDPAHLMPATQDSFDRVITPVLTRLLSDATVADALRPAFENALAESLSFIGAQVETLTRQLQSRSEQLGVGEALLRTLARRYAPGSDGDLLQAHAGLEQALEAAQRLITAGSMPSNLDAQVQATLAEVGKLVLDEKFEAADDLLAKQEARVSDTIAEAEQALRKLRESRFDLARTRNDPAAAAQHILARLTLDHPANLFDALRAEQDRWYIAGRDLGGAFDLALSIHLAQASLTQASTADERGAALNDLGTALATLGSRDSDPARLEAAIAAFESALLERTRDRVALDWAATQNNLGAALQDLGTRQGDPARLEAAIAAYEAALLELTRDRVPLDWAATQNNLGAALRELGTRQGDPARLEAAIAAYESALLEYTRTRVPLDWAMTQNNLGAALRELGTRQGDPARLEAAIAAYEAALLERTRDRVPLGWAMTQNNLGAALQDLGTRLGDPTRLEAAVAAYESALLELTRDRVPLDWAMTQNNLGVALQDLGTRQGDPTRLEAAVVAYETALLEYTRDRAPLHWAGTQANLASLDLAFHALTPDPARLTAARGKALLARQVFEAAKASGYVAQVDELLAEINDLAP